MSLYIKKYHGRTVDLRATPQSIEFNLWCGSKLKIFLLVFDWSLFVAMLDIFRGLKNFIKVSHVHIDSSVFRLHYSITVMILLAFSMIVTTRQYVGNPIDCIHNKEIPEEIINTYCWIHSTYTIPSAFSKTLGIDVAHPGIEMSKPDGEKRYIKYYQWVCFCLFFQVRARKFHAETEELVSRHNQIFS